MFFDDSGAIIVSTGHLHTYYGYSIDELPTYQTDSAYAAGQDSRSYCENLTDYMEEGGVLKPLLEKGKLAGVREYVSFVENLVYKFNNRFEQHPLLLVDKFNQETQKTRAELAQIFFEEKGVPCLFFVNEAITGLFSTGSFSGVYLDSGEYQTTISPIHDGYLLKKNIKHVPLGGSLITEKMRHLLETKSNIKRVEPFYNVKSEYLYYSGAENMQREVKVTLLNKNVHDSYRSFFINRIVRSAKEKLLYIKQKKEDGKNELENLLVELPDGQKLEFMDHEVEFNSLLFTKENKPGEVNFAKELHELIEHCDIDIRKDLYTNIVVAGGNSLVPGFVENLEMELKNIIMGQMKIKLSSSNKAYERRMASWIGASILSSSSAFQNLWIGKQDYAEYGENVLMKKCLN